MEAHPASETSFFWMLDDGQLQKKKIVSVYHTSPYCFELIQAWYETQIETEAPRLAAAPLKHDVWPDLRNCTF